MKNPIFFLFLFFSIQMTGQIKYHVAAGPTVNLTFNDFIYLANVPQAGFFGEFGFTKEKTKWNYHLDFQYQQVNWMLRSQNLPDWASDYDIRYRLNYLTINPSAEYKLTSKLGLEAGGFFSVDMGEQFYIEARNRFSGSLNAVANVDFGISLGAKFYINEQFGIGLQYMQGFNDLTDFLHTDPEGHQLMIDSHDVNNVLQLQLSYSL